VLAAFGDDHFFFAPFDPSVGRRRTRGFKWFHACQDPRTLMDVVIEAVREWRYTLAEQLQDYGYAIERDDNGAYRVGQALLRPKRESDIVSERASIRRAPFYILQTDALDDLPVYRQLETVLNTFRQIAKASRRKPETVLQLFFEQNPHLLARRRYGRQHAKPVLPRKGKRPWAPDFVHEPLPLSEVHRDWSITDLKLPDAKILERPRAFHRGLSWAIHRAINQLSDYRDQIQSRDPKIREAVIRRFGTVPLRPRRAVVIGRRPNNAEEIELVHRRARDLGVRVDLITYDDLLDDEAQRILLQSVLGVTL